MAGGWELGVGFSNMNTYGQTASASAGLVLTTGVANTKGTYVQFTSAAVADMNWMAVFLDGTLTTGSGFAVDVAYGAAGSEQVALSNLAYNNTTLQQVGTPVFWPVSIKAGTRIALRAQSTVASDTPRATITCCEGAYNDWQNNAASDTIGYLTASTKGTAITAGANTPGTYVQLTSSTVNDYRGFALAFDNQNSIAGAGQSSFLMDLAVGASGSEKVLLPQFMVAGQNFSGGVYTPIYTPVIECAIKAGSRIAARGQVNGSLTSIGVTFYGLR